MVLRLPDSWSTWNLGIMVFGEKGKPEYPEKDLSQQGGETNKKTQLTCQHWSLKPGRIGGRRMFSPLRHPCDHPPRRMHVFFPTHTTTSITSNCHLNTFYKQYFPYSNLHSIMERLKKVKKVYINPCPCLLNTLLGNYCDENKTT